MAYVKLSFTIVYNANGGTGAPASMTRKIPYADTRSFPYTITQEVTSTIPNRSGYNFLGWSTNASATTPTYSPGSTVSHTFPYNTGSDQSYTMNLYAVWQQSSYVIFYRAGTYGTGTDTSDTKLGGVDLTLKGRIFTRSGYQQTGWSLSADGSGYAYNIGGKYTANAGATLYPYWSIVKSTITSVTDSVPADGSTQGTVEINRPNSNFTHKVVISLGTRSAEYTNVGTSLTFTIPAAWLDQIPTATAAVATVTLTTYNNGSQVGTPDTKSFTVTVPDSVVPTISLTGANVSDNQTVSSWDVLVQGFSKIALTATVTAGSGATISSIVFSGDGVSQTGIGTTVMSELLQNAGSRTWTATITDSRGKTATATLTRTVNEYYPAAVLAFSAFRSTAEGNPSPSGGQYVTAVGNYSFASCAGHNSASVKKIEYKRHTESTWTTGENSAASGTRYTFGTISLLYTYDIRLTVTDALGSTAAYTVNVASVNGVSFGLNGRCARFGGPVQYDDRFECDWDAQFDGQVEAPLFLQTGFIQAAAVEPGTTKTVSVTFDTPFMTQPYVTFSMLSPQTIGMELCTASIWNITETGFSARLTNGYESNRTLGICWIATARKITDVSITDQPVSQIVDVGDGATFAIVAVNATAYQWYMKNQFAFDWVTISGDAAKAPEYSLTNIGTNMNNFRFKCVASNNKGSVESNAAILNVNGATVISDRNPYIKRASAGGMTIGNREIDMLVGGTVAWNQYCDYNETIPTNTWDALRVGISITGHSLTITSNSNTAAQKAATLRDFTSKSNHKYLVTGYITPPSQTYNAVYGLYSGTTAAERYIITAGSGRTDISRVLTPSTNGCSFKFLLANATPSGTSAVSENLMIFDLDEMFGSPIANYIYNLEQANAGSGVAWFKSLFQSTFYARNSGELLSVNASAHIMRDDSDAVIATYPLDSTIVLHGIPKLDADNKLYYDGDTYESDGTVTRKYGVRAYQTGDVTDGSTMVTDGTTTVYALTTPTTETADPYQNPQSVDASGTEEYTDSRAVQMPVGHYTEYSDTNLTD